MKTKIFLAPALLLALLLAPASAHAQPQQRQLLHVVSLKFKGTATPEQIEAVEAAFVALKDKIPAILWLKWGTNVSPEKHDKGFTHCFILAFATDKDRDAYLVHPDHDAFGQILGPVLADVFVLDFWDRTASPLTAIPAAKDQRWLDRHQSFLQDLKSGPVDLLFIGDSITDSWRSTGKQIWADHFAPLNAANIGLSGDRTQHVLWRLQHDELEGISPRLVVLMIGTNNLKQGAHEDTPEDTAAGVKAIITEIRRRLPDTKVLILGVFPRGEKPDDPLRERVSETNALLEPLADNQRIFYLDIGPRFLESDGTAPKQIMPDSLHLTEQGYRIWGDAIIDKVKELMGK